MTVTNPMDGKPIEPLPEYDRPDADTIAAIREAGKPAVLRGIAEQWPTVEIGRTGQADAMVEHLLAYDSGAPMKVLVGDPKAGGRFIYNDTITGYNFRREEAPARTILPAMLRYAEGKPYIYAGAQLAQDVFPDFGRDNPLDLVPEGTEPRLWIGNASRVAPHYDVSENIAVCAMGRRQFMIFPPEQVANLYIGPWEHTPAGPECSIVDVREPDLNAHPRYVEARNNALLADLQPGDGVYIPPLWWHTVEAKGDLNVLVNYWWAAPGHNGLGMAAMAHAVLTLRDLPQTQKAAWRTFFDHYIFSEQAGSSADHLPDSAKGVRGPASPARDERMRAFIKSMI